MRVEFRLGAVVFLALFAWGCQEPSTLMEPEGPGILLDKDGITHPHGGNDGGNDAPATFTATVASESGSTVWTNGPQVVQNANKKNWLHVFDSGGNGTRGAPDYDNAQFDTQIHLQPASTVGCVDENGVAASGALLTRLFGVFEQAISIDRVFDFQVDFDVGDPGEEDGPSFFLFRWEDGAHTYSAGTEYINFDNPQPNITFLNMDPSDIDNPAATRVFEISGGTVVVRELRRNKAIATLGCPNLRKFLVTVAPDPAA